MARKKMPAYKKIIKKMKKKKVFGFTLIELLAVIIILGVLMIIAIPSVTEYIQTSRKNSYITTAGQFINGARNKVNSAEMPMYDVEATYYVPTSCIHLEKGGTSPFGEIEEGYIVVTYDGRGYDYYFTVRDDSQMGIYLTYEDLLDDESVKTGVKTLDTSIAIGEKNKIVKIDDSCSVENAETYVATSSITERGKVDVQENGGSGSSEPVMDPSMLYYQIVTDNEVDGTPVLDNVSSKYVSSSTGIDFAVAPSDTNGKGVYLRNGTENNTYPIYYYRGAVTDNNVIFANYCWKILRTTETGGIKLVYSGPAIGGKCNNTGTNLDIGISVYNANPGKRAYIGYMYGNPASNVYEEEHENINESDIKIYIDSWYESNLSSYANYLEDAVWCNDRVESDRWPAGHAWFAAYDRLGLTSGTAVTPKLECTNKNDRFTVNETMSGRVEGNGALDYPIALITGDEATLAGNGYRGYGSSSYLTSGNDWYWTMTPIYFNGAFSNNLLVTTNGAMKNTYVYYESGRVRPAISLRKGVKVSATGDGTANNPFVIQ